MGSNLRGALPKRVTDDLLREVVAAYQQTGNQYGAAGILGKSQAFISKHLKIAKDRGLYSDPAGSINSHDVVTVELPKRGRKVFIVTSAQNRTRLHEACWQNLLALADHDRAKILVSTFKYNKDAQGQRAQAKWETREQELAALYPQEILPYICDDRVELAPNLVFCGELNVLPTAENPLEGLETYTYRKSTIVPHPKLAMTSIPTMKSEGVKLMYTTGCVTQRNYIKRKVGYKAEHFHSYGGLIVEITPEGGWYVRQLVHGPDGSIYDLDRRVKGGVYSDGHRVTNICWGDIHADKIDEEVAALSFGTQNGSMLETLRPYSQHVHDVLDFSGRSHHTRRDPHEVYRSHVNGKWELTGELRRTADILFGQIARPWCETFVVNSNHDRHLDRWLKEVDWREDPINAKLLLTLNLKVLDHISNGNDQYSLLEHALRFHGHNGSSEFIADKKLPVRFLLEDESNIILPNIDGGIEAGLHGDRGANGAKGSLATFAKTDRKTNTADKHWAGIHNHAYQCGLTGKLNQGYNHGLSNWTAADIITYPNATRAIVSPWKGRWRG